MLAHVTQAAYLTGQFLLAVPGMADPRFDRAVIAMCGHDANGAIGIGLGTVIPGLGFHQLLHQFDIPVGEAEDAPVHFGGPVSPRRGFVIHSTDWSGQDSIRIAGRWVLSGTIDVLRAIAAGEGPAKWVSALGYAGWGEGQLEGELSRPGWLPVDAGAELLFDTAPEDRWTRAMAVVGIDPRLLVAGVGTA